MDIFSDEKKKEAWIMANYDFICQEFGKENIVRFVLHMDEKTPHIHAVTVNLTKDGRLSARDVIGSRKMMQERQDRYADRMEEFGLKRGLRNTGIKHEDAKEYYKRMNEALAMEDDGNSLEVRDTLFGVDFGVNNTKTRENFKNANLSLKTALNEKSRSLAEVKKQNERLNSRNISLSTEIAELKKQLEAMKKKVEALQQRINKPDKAYLLEKLAIIEREERQKQEAKRKQEEEAYRLWKLESITINAVTEATIQGKLYDIAGIKEVFQTLSKYIPKDYWSEEEIDNAIREELSNRGINLQSEQQEQEEELPRIRLRR